MNPGDKIYILAGKKVVVDTVKKIGKRWGTTEKGLVIDEARNLVLHHKNNDAQMGHLFFMSESRLAERLAWDCYDSLRSKASKGVALSEILPIAKLCGLLDSIEVESP